MPADCESSLMILGWGWAARRGLQEAMLAWISMEAEGKGRSEQPTDVIRIEE